MANPAGESKDEALKLDFDRRVMLQFRGSVVTSDAGLLAYRELDDALGLSTMAGETLADARTGRNERHALVGLLRQSVFGRLAGYEDVNDAERLRHDPAMRWIIGGKAAQGRVSRVSPVQTAMRNCTRDEGGPFEVGNQVLISSHRKLLLSKAMVVSVAETPGQDSGRQG